MIYNHQLLVVIMLKRGQVLLVTLTLLILVVFPSVRAASSTLVSEDSFKVTELSSYSNTLDGNIKVTFRSIPSGAAIFIDDIERGYAPRQIYLSPGYHTAQVVAPGQSLAEFDFFLEPNLKYTYTIRFLESPLKSRLKVLSGSREHNALLMCQALRGSDDLVYSWDFGDGFFLVTSESEVQHYYANSGSYRIKCSIYDELTGRRTESQRTVVIR